MTHHNAIVKEDTLGVTAQSGFVAISFMFGAMMLEVGDAERLVQQLNKAIATIKEQEQEQEQEHDGKA